MKHAHQAHRLHYISTISEPTDQGGSIYDIQVIFSGTVLQIYFKSYYSIS